MRWIALIVAMVGCAGFECRSQRSFSGAEQTGKVASGLVESSGIAPSFLTRGAFYSHNDSGAKPILYLVEPDGDLLREISIDGAKAYDWEDMASARLGSKFFLFIGDIGDNGGVRKSIFVYRLPEGRGKSAKIDRVIELAYPDEPRNAETLLVHPKTGDITIVTKTTRPEAIVYGLSSPKRSGKYTLKKLGTFAVPESIPRARSVTGGAWSPDGKRVVLRTYLSAFEYDATGKGPWFKSTPRRMFFGLMPQSEAICYSLDGTELYATSEGSPCPISRVRIEP